MIKNLIIPILLIAVGSVLLIKGYEYPIYWDEAAVDKLEQECDIHNPKKYYAEIEKLRTPRIYLIDWGHGLIALGLSFLFYMSFFKIKKLSDFKLLFTPHTTGRLCRWISLLLIISIPNAFIYYFYKASRGDYPWFADSIAIPIFGVFVQNIFLLLVLNLLIYSLLKKRQMPISLWHWKDSKDKSKVAKSVLCGIIVLYFGLRLYYDVQIGNVIGVFLSIGWIYVWLSIRAASGAPLVVVEEERNIEI